MNNKIRNKEKITNFVKKQYMTAMIGWLDILETELAEEIDFDSQEWQAVRTKLMDHGHNQLNRTLIFLDNYEHELKQYVTEFVIRKSPDVQ